MLLILALMGCALLGAGAAAQTSRPAPSAGGVTLYVSKLGDDSDGSSWERAFNTIQAALGAVPNDRGGHRIIVRPDTYLEANLFPAHRGAQGAYNQLIGDADGALGSGARGWVVIDSSDPAQMGFKSYDWWGTIRAHSQGWSPQHTDATFSAICWDRWELKHLYATGGDAGLFFDCTDHVEPFSVLVEDCVSIGRAFGGGVASCLSRHDEPITFRRCHLWALDFWGDTSGAYIRVENTSMPDKPDAVFEDCVMVGPQCSLKASNFGFHTYTRIKLDRCRLVTLNFSQPHGTPSPGIIQSVQEGKLLHVDLRDCALMGYKVFGVIVEEGTAGDIGYTTAGDVKAYVQFQQPIPEGFHRLPHWPGDIFESISPPDRSRHLRGDRELVRRDLCELTPILWEGRLCHMECARPGRGGKREDYYLFLRDPQTGEEPARFAEGYGLASAIVHDGVFYAFASRWEDGAWRDVTLFESPDLKQWRSELVIKGDGEQIFNTSVCEGPGGFVMAYESNDPAYPAFTIKFARSDDLRTWTKLPDATFGMNRYTACPCIRYSDGHYYVLYLERRSPRHFFETYITRSSDLRHWELSAANPVLTPQGIDEGVNTSDPELIELDGRACIYFAVGDQLTWMNMKRMVCEGSLADFLGSWYVSPGIPDWGSAAEQGG